MRAVIQRVHSASVETEGEVVSSIGMGLLVFAGFHADDSPKDMDYVINKTIDARVFNDSDGMMNLSVKDINGDILVVSQFTLYGDMRKGRRPSYSSAMPQDKASVFYESFINLFRGKFQNLQTGIFRADMKVSLVNNGPVTILLDSSRIL